MSTSTRCRIRDSHRYRDIALQEQHRVQRICSDGTTERSRARRSAAGAHAGSHASDRPDQPLKIVHHMRTEREQHSPARGRIELPRPGTVSSGAPSDCPFDGHSDESPDRLAVEQFLQSNSLRRCTKQIIDHANSAAPPREFAHLCSLVRIDAKRFFAQYMFACPQCRCHHFEV